VTPTPFAAEHVADDPPELDILFAATKHSIAGLLRAYAPDVALCTGLPWLIPAEAIAVPKHGIVNGHPSLDRRIRPRLVAVLHVPRLRRAFR
jgi:methionyl-tRNA formyltransferase